MKPGRVRTTLRLAHRWVSLVLGLPIALIAASGAAVDYWFEVDALAAPAFYQGRDTGPPLPLDSIAAAAHRAVPGGRIENIFLNQDGRVAIASLTGAWGDRLRDVAIDRASGKVLGQRWQDEALIDQLYDFHTRLLLGEAGEAIVLALALVFVGLLASGLFLWWPSPRRWRSALSIRLAPNAKLLDLHAKLGIYGLLLTALAGGTAIILLWPAGDANAPARTGSAQTVPVPQSLQVAVDAVVSAHPDWQPVNVLSPEAAGEPLRIILWRPATFLRGEAIELVSVRRDTGAVALTPDLARQPLARALHNGRIGGEIGRAAMALGALLPLLLWVTGLVRWLRVKHTALAEAN